MEKGEAVKAGKDNVLAFGAFWKSLYLAENH